MGKVSLLYGNMDHDYMDHSWQLGRRMPTGVSIDVKWMLFVKKIDNG